MKLSMRCVLAACLALAVGCRSNAGQELVERELMSQENRIYELEDVVGEYQARLDSCQRENETLLAELGRYRTSGKARVKRVDKNGRHENEMIPPVIESGEGEAGVPFDGAPVIAPPDPHMPEGEHLAKKGKVPAKPAAVPRRGVVKGQVSRGPIDRIVMQVTLNRKLTGGHNVDGQPGDEGVMVVIEPLNAAGDLIEVPGQVSIVVLDPAMEGEAARVARWDFTAKEAADHIKRTPLGDGLHFDLRWPHVPPTHRVLNLYVRYTTADGRRLQVEKQIEVDPPHTDDAAGDRLTKQHPVPAAEPDGVSDGPEPPRAEATAVQPAEEEERQTDAKASENGSRWAPYR